MKKFFAIVFFFTFSLAAGQSYDFVRFAESSGLPLAQTYTIHQHKNGAIVAGLVGGGISLYNGSEFHNFSQNEGLPNSIINDVQEDSKGNLWIATDDGISKFDGAVFENHLKTDKKIIVWKIAIDKNDNIFLATNDGLIKFNESGNVNLTDSLLSKSVRIYYLQINDNGTMVFGSGKKVWEYDQKEIKELKRFSGKSIKNVFKPARNQIVIHANDSLYSYDSRFEDDINYINSFSVDEVSALIKDSKNNYWIGTIRNGVYKINENGIVNYNRESGFTNLGVWNIIEDNNSKLWFATDKGLYYLNHVNVRLYKNTLEVSDIWSVYVSPENKIYVGTMEKGIFEFANGAFRRVFSIGKKNYVYYQIIQDRNGDWWGATDSKLLYGGKDKNILDKTKELGPKNIYTVFQDYKDNVWVGTNYEGLYRFDGKEFIKEKIDSTINDIQSFVEDRDKNLWIGTNIGLYKFDGKKYSYPEELKSLNRFGIDHLILDRYRNVIWGGAFDKGVFRYFLPTDSTKGRLQIFSRSDGLNDNSVLSVVEDFDGNIWATTNKGLNKLVVNDADSSVAIIPFFPQDGLLGLEGVQMSAAVDSSGMLFIGTAKGLLTFNPRELSGLKKKPVPKIVGLTAVGFENTITFSKDYLFMDSGNDITYNIPGTINNIRINFCGLNFPSSVGTKFLYKLNKLDWSKPTKETTISYNNLEPGNYTFKFKIVSESNDPQTETASINFSVSAPIYKTNTFRISVFVAVILLGFLFTYIRTRSVKKKNRELRANIEERKKINTILREAKETAERSEKLKDEFLAQMSHEIRSPIHTILSFTQLLEADVKDKVDDDLKESFNAIKKAGRRIVRTIDLILNMSQIQTNTIETQFKIVDLIKEVLEPLYAEYSQTARMEGLKLNFVKETDDAKIEGDEYTINQIIANLINNAIKYTNEGEITLRVFKTADNLLAVEVADTGIGISEEYLPQIFETFSQEEQGYTRRYDGNGLGLALVKKYCQINNAEISVKSEKGKGSVFTVVFK